MELKEDWEKIVNHFGLDEQLKHWFTEIYELIQAIDKDDGTIESKQHITSELADNFNFLKQIQTNFEITDYEVEREQEYKNKRTLTNIEKENFTGVKQFKNGEVVLTIDMSDNIQPVQDVLSKLEVSNDFEEMEELPTFDFKEFKNMSVEERFYATINEYDILDKLIRNQKRIIKKLESEESEIENN